MFNVKKATKRELQIVVMYWLAYLADQDFFALPLEIRRLRSAYNTLEGITLDGIINFRLTFSSNTPTFLEDIAFFTSEKEQKNIKNILFNKKDKFLTEQDLITLEDDYFESIMRRATQWLGENRHFLFPYEKDLQSAYKKVNKLF
jgi:hypothetical protein